MKNLLFKSLITGDSKGIQRIYDLVFPNVLRFIVRNNGNKEDAKDIFQKALIQLITRFKLKDIHLDIAIEAYLFTVCKNLWRQELNSKKRVTKEQNSIYINEKINEPLEEDLTDKKWKLYRKKFDELSENCKTVLTLLYKKMSYKEMLDILPYTSEVVVRQRVFKCRKKLSTLIRADIQFKKIKEEYD